MASPFVMKLFLPSQLFFWREFVYMVLSNTCCQVWKRCGTEEKKTNIETT